MTRLYAFAWDHKKISGPTALAEALGLATPQRVKNWEMRGISQAGANIAQQRLGCNCNWLLGKSNDPSAHGVPLAKNQPPQASTPWPFQNVTPWHYALLTEEEKLHLEKDILLRVKEREREEKKVVTAH